MVQTQVHITRAAFFVLFLATLMTIPWAMPPLPSAQAETAVDFPGTVLLVDQAASKLTVKKDGGGTRFTFVVTDKTQFEGAIKGLKDVKKDDKVTVTYVVTGNQYLAQKITKK